MAAIKNSLMTGMCFGLTSGVITTLGLMVGLHSGTHSKIAVIGGIITIAIADAFSDALGIHISEEAKNTVATREVWEATTMTFISKFLVALMFLIPVLMFPLPTAILVGICWGLSLLCFLSYLLAKRNGGKTFVVVVEHLLIALGVITITHYVGDWVAREFC
ncbi:MAG: hypothetical protein WC560_01775 [Syntrophales bacterium]